MKPARSALASHASQAAESILGPQDEDPRTVELPAKVSTVDDLRLLEKAEEWGALIGELRNMLRAEPKLLEDAWVKAWMGKRWRNIFIREATADSRAVDHATEKSRLNVIGLFKDQRSDAQKVAECYLRLSGPEEWVWVTGTDAIRAMPEVVLPENINTGVLFAPGLVNGWLPRRAFDAALPRIVERFGIKVMRVDAHPMRGCIANLQDFKDALGGGRCRDAEANLVEGLDFPDRFICIGYSKGAPDLLTLFAECPEFQKRCRAMYTWAGAIGGSYMADDAYNTFRRFPNDLLNTHVERVLQLLCPVVELRQGPLYRLPEVDVGDALLHLTTDFREAYNKKHMATYEQFPFPVFHLTGSTEAESLPYFQVGGYKTLARYDANNDMQLTQAEAMLDLPQSAHLAMVHANHWDMSYPDFPLLYTLGSRQLVHFFPREAAMTAMVLLCAELGLMSD